MKSFAQRLGLPSTVTADGRFRVTTAYALGRITPTVDRLLTKAKSDGERKRIAEALLMEADRVLKNGPPQAHE
jgi:hypothetical protein